MNFVMENWDRLVLIVTGVVTTASIIVKMTPTPKDDKVLAKIIKFLNFLAINTKGNGFEPAPKDQNSKK